MMKGKSVRHLARCKTNWIAHLAPEPDSLHMSSREGDFELARRPQHQRRNILGDGGELCQKFGGRADAVSLTDVETFPHCKP